MSFRSWGPSSSQPLQVLADDDILLDDIVAGRTAELDMDTLAAPGVRQLRRGSFRVLATPLQQGEDDGEE